METSAHMDLARWAGVTAVGSPAWPGSLAVGEPPDSSYVVLKTPDERYLELYNNAGAMDVRAIAPLWTPGRDNMIGTFGKPVNSCLWVRGLGSTTLFFVESGAYNFFGVNNAGVLTAPAAAPFNPQMPGQSRMGGAFDMTGRLVIDSAPGTPSALALQAPNGVPWFIWANTAGVLRVTDFPTFRLGV